jgi:hypothetical protein
MHGHLVELKTILSQYVSRNSADISGGYEAMRCEISNPFCSAITKLLISLVFYGFGDTEPSLGNDGTISASWPV